MSNKKRNVCFLTRYPVYPLLGGVERVTASLSDVFETHGIACSFLSLKENSNPECIPAGKMVMTLPKKHSAIFFETFLREHDINIVIWQQGGSHCFPFPEICKKMGVKVVSCSHGQPDYYRHLALSKARGFDSHKICGLKKRLKVVWKLFWGNYFHRRAIRHNAKKSDAYVLLSPNYLPHLKSFFLGGNLSCRVFSIANINSFSVQNVDFSAKKKELLFVGRLAYADKRPDYLLRIWAKVEAKFPDWSLRLVGDGRDRKMLEMFAQKLDLKRVFFEGFQDPKEYYRSASVFCLTSAIEGFPMALGEAMTYGCVPVAFDSFAGIRDLIVNDETGAIVPAFDLELYAMVLEKLMCDDCLRERFARAAMAHIGNFSQKKILECWFALFDELGV